MLFSKPGSNVLPPMEQKEINAARSLLDFAFSKPDSLLSRAQPLEPNPSKGLAHPKSISASLIATSIPLPAPHHHQAANAILGLTHNASQTTDNPRAVVETANASNAASLPVGTAPTQASNEANGTSSDSPLRSTPNPPLPPFSTLIDGDRQLRLHSLSPEASESSYPRKPVAGKGSIVGDRLDEEIYLAEQKWRPNAKDKPPRPRVRKGKKAPTAPKREKAPPAPRKRKAPAAKKTEPEASAASAAATAAAEEDEAEEENRAVPTGAKRKRAAAPKAKKAREEEPVADVAPAEEGVGQAESSVSPTAASEQEQRGRPKRARRATKKIAESY